MGKNEIGRENKIRGLECVIILDRVIKDEASFFHYKDELNDFSSKVQVLTKRSEQILNERFSEETLICAGFVYDDMRFQVDCKINKLTKQEMECKRAYGSVKMKHFLGISDKELISYQRLCADVKRKGEPVLAFLEQYKQDILNMYRLQIPYLWHITVKQDIIRLNPSRQRENMYYNDICDAVFATSSYEEVLLYMGRVFGDEMMVMDNYCFYKKNPYDAWNDCRIQLKGQAAVCYLDVNGFFPVIDFVMTDYGTAHLKFGHEWIHKGEVQVLIKEKIKTIPARDIRRYNVFYGLKNICMESYVDYFKHEAGLENRNKYLQNLVEKKILAFVNLKQI